jgi:hypothetical protein
MSRHSALIVPISIVLMTATIPAVGTVLFVDARATGAGNGSTWADAFTTVQPALDAAQTGDQVWVAEGRYTGCMGLGKSVELYGGFAGNENPATFQLSNRNRQAHETILDGERAGSVVSFYGSGGRIDGFTITGGDAEGAGGGIHQSQSRAIMANNIITGNRAEIGGGIYAYGSSTAMWNNKIINNTADVGGGLYVAAQTSGPIANNMILGNSASQAGGGMYLASSYVGIFNNTIAANSAPQYGGGVYLSGGPQSLHNCIVAFNSSGIFGETGNPSIWHTCIFGNTMYDFGGSAVFTQGQGNIAADPMLSSLAYGDAHIQPGSPCIDAGNNAFAEEPTDFDGQPRIQPVAGVVDLGGDESDGTLWSVEPRVIVRVSEQGSDDWEGFTWAQAKRTVQAAIDAAGPQGGDVWVQQGIYCENLLLRPFVHVYGGFSGTEASRIERDASAHRSVLDGGGQGSVVTVRAGHRVATLDGFTIRGGSAEYGGGICLLYASPFISNNILMDNVASREGGGMYLQGSCAWVAGNTVRGGTAEYGAGVYDEASRATFINNVMSGNATSGYGGGMFLRWSQSSVIGNTIAGNSALHGGGLYFYACASNLILANSIVAFNSSGIAWALSNNLQPRSVCAFGNTDYDYAGLQNPAGTQGNISANPAFVRNPVPGIDEGDLRLTAASPCIDAGNNAIVPATPEFDAAGSPRFVDDPFVADTGTGAPPIVDMGAYEFRLAGDCDLNWQVDLTDYADFADCLAGPMARRTIDCACADLDADGDVDLADFAEFNEAFNE